MAFAQNQSNPDDDFIKVGPDATATFDNSASNPTEHASSENLNAAEDDDEEEDHEDLDDEEEDEDEEVEDEEEDDEDEEIDDDVVEDDDEDEEEDEEDHDLATGPKAPSVYRKA